jgi:hypothetical protein
VRRPRGEAEGGPGGLPLDKAARADDGQPAYAVRLVVIVLTRPAAWASHFAYAVG